MRINKSTESSSFDEYLKIISSFNKKRNPIKKMAMLEKIAIRLGVMDDVAKHLDDFLDVIGDAGKSSDEAVEAFSKFSDEVKSAARALSQNADKYSDDFIKEFFTNRETFAEYLEANYLYENIIKNDKYRPGQIRVGADDGYFEAVKRVQELSEKLKNAPLEADPNAGKVFEEIWQSNKTNLSGEAFKRAVDSETMALRETEMADQAARAREQSRLEEARRLEEAGGVEGQRSVDAPEPEGTRSVDAPEPEGTRSVDAPEPEGTRSVDAPEPETPTASVGEVVGEGDGLVRALDEMGDGAEVTEDALKAIKEDLASYAAKTEKKIAELTSRLDDALESGDAKTVGDLRKLVEDQGDVLSRLDDKLKALENSKGSLSPAVKAEIEELIKNAVKTAEKTEDTAGGIIASLAKGGSRASRVAGGLWTAGKYALFAATAILAAPYVMGMFGGGDEDPPRGIPPEQGGQAGISDRRGGLSWRERQRQSEGPVFRAIREASKNNNMAELNTLIESAATNEKYKQYITEDIFGRKTMIILPREFLGMRYAFVNPTGGDVGKNPELLGDMVLRSLRRMDLGGKQYNAAKRTDGPETQRILNKAATVILQADLVPGGLFPGAKGRADKALFGDPVKTTRRSQRKSEKRSRRSLRDRFEQESLSEPLRMAAKENISRSIDQIRKESSLKIKEFYELSTNNKHKSDISLDKRADEISKSYHKDAVKDLREQDKTLRDYFAGLGRLYEEESEKRKPDQKELYELHDETGSDLTLSAHPNAIRLSDAMGDGGLVENGLEQKNKMEGVALRTPTGNFESRYANLKDLLQKVSK